MVLETIKTAKKAISPKKAKSWAKERSLPKKKQKTLLLGYAFLMKPRNEYGQWVRRERRFRKRGPRESRERSSSCLQKRANKSTLRESTVDACNEKRSHLQKSDWNLKRTTRYRWIRLFGIDKTSGCYSIDCIKCSPFHKMKTSPIMNAIELFFLDLCNVAFQ